MVRYKFDTDVDDTRKEAFRAAAADWRTHTCIAVVEDDNAEAWSSLVELGNVTVTPMVALELKQLAIPT
jgi:hypothetical protein